MNTNTSENSTNPESLSARIDKLRQGMEDGARENKKRQKTYLIAGAVIAAVSMLSFSSLTMQIGKLDAQALTEFGRLEVEAQMPGEIANLREYLTENAGEFIASGVRGGLSWLPTVRQSLSDELIARAEAASVEYEERLVLAMADTIRISRQRIDEAYADKSPDERLEVLVVEIADNFTKSAMLVCHDLYPEYAREMNRVKSFLVNLQSTDERGLTDRQRIQKDLIETFLRLIMEEGITPF